MKFAGIGKALKGLGKKAGGLSKKLKNAVTTPRAGYTRVGQESLLGGTTKSAASRAFAPVKAKAKSMGTKVSNAMHNTKMRAKDASRFARGRGSMAGTTKSGYAGGKGDYVGKQDNDWADFDSLVGHVNYGSGGARKGPKMSDADMSKVFGTAPKTARGKAEMALTRAKERASGLASQARSTANQAAASARKAANNAAKSVGQKAFKAADEATLAIGKQLKKRAESRARRSGTYMSM